MAHELIASLGFRLEMQPCALCRGLDFETLARQDRHLLGLHTVGCRTCGLVQTNPRPDSEQLGRFYAEHYRQFYQGVGDPSAAYIVALNKDKRLEYTVRYLHSAFALGVNSRILDYGCGEGSLFVALRKSGFDGELMGIELDENFARFAAQHGRARVGANLCEFRDVDGVVINHVLEHLPDPLQVLTALKGTLREGGAVYIDVPDTEEYAHVTDLHIAHILHFSERTLRRMLEQAGYTVAVCEKHRPPFHPRSVRLVARPGVAASTSATSSASEQFAWARVRRAGRYAWPWIVRRRLAGVRLLRAPYRFVRGVARTVLRR